MKILKWHGFKIVYFLVVVGLPTFFLSDALHRSNVIPESILWAAIFGFVFIPTSTFCLIRSPRFTGALCWLAMIGLTLINVAVAYGWILLAIGWGSN